MDCCRIISDFWSYSNTPTPNSTTPLVPTPKSSTTSRPEPIYRHTYRSNPFRDLFKDKVIKQGPETTPDPSKEFVAELMLDHIQIIPSLFPVFANRHSSALLAERAKEKINDLVNQWKTNDEFSYKDAETAIKEILGEGIKDEDVIFMLRMFCITKKEYSDFEKNYQDLMESLQ